MINGLIKDFETQSSRSLQYDNIWVDANTSATRYAYIEATPSTPLTYFTIRQEATEEVDISRIFLTRPQNDGYCYIGAWDGRTTVEISDGVISTSILYNEWFGRDKYAWTSGTLTLEWIVTTGDSGARLNLWAW